MSRVTRLNAKQNSSLQSSSPGQHSTKSPTLSTLSVDIAELKKMMTTITTNNTHILGMVKSVYHLLTNTDYTADSSVASTVVDKLDSIAAKQNELSEFISQSLAADEVTPLNENTTSTTSTTQTQRRKRKPRKKPIKVPPTLPRDSSEQRDTDTALNSSTNANSDIINGNSESVLSENNGITQNDLTQSVSRVAADCSLKAASKRSQIYVTGCDFETTETAMARYVSNKIDGRAVIAKKIIPAGISSDKLYFIAFKLVVPSEMEQIVLSSGFFIDGIRARVFERRSKNSKNSTNQKPTG